MGFLNIFKRKPKKISKNFYNFPSLNPSDLEKNELLNLINNSKIDDYTQSISNQSRSLSTSNALINGFLKTIDSEIFGDRGITLDLSSKDRLLNKKIEDTFFDWREKEQDGGLDFYDIESLVLTYLIRDGECFLHVSESTEGLRVSVIDNHNIAYELNDERGRIFYGIKKDKNLNPISYFVKNDEGRIDEVSAKNIIHIFKKLDVRQHRGLSDLVSIITPAHQKDRFRSAELRRARLQSEITGFIVKNNTDFASDLMNEENNKVVPSYAEVGKMTYIDEDVKPVFTESHNATNMEAFITQTDREIAKGLGISYATLTGNLSDVNYSSIRHGGSEQRRQFRRMQNFIIRKLHNKIFKRWLLNELKLGFINTKEYYLALENYTFKPQGWEYIDPYKETNANALAIQTGQKTLSDILRSQGKELDTHIDELKKEKELREILKENNRK